MTEYEENLIERQQTEIQRLERETENFGFMEAYFSCIDGFGRANIHQYSVRSNIKKSITAFEYDILRQTRFTSSKDQIEAYVALIQRLLDAGVFDQSDSGEAPLKFNTGAPGSDNRKDKDARDHDTATSDTAEKRACCSKCKDKDDETVDCIKAVLAAFEKAVEETPTDED